MDEFATAGATKGPILFAEAPIPTVSEGAILVAGATDPVDTDFVVENWSVEEESTVLLTGLPVITVIGSDPSCSSGVSSILYPNSKESK